MLPIGGIREKSLAAQRAGLKRVILPRENEADLTELPPETREALEFIPADTIEDVFAAAFDGKRPAARGGLAPVDRRPGRARPSRALSEAREELPAGAGVAVRLPPAEQLVLALARGGTNVISSLAGAVVDAVCTRACGPPTPPSPRRRRAP